MRRYALLSILLLFICGAAMGAVSSFYISDGTNTLPFGTGGTITFDNISGTPNNITVLPPAVDISAHTTDATIHFSADSLTHDALNGAAGYSSHSSIDAALTAHFDDISRHFPVFDNISADFAALWSAEFTRGYIDSGLASIIIPTPLPTATPIIIPTPLPTSTPAPTPTPFTGSVSIPTGTIWMFAGATAPSGWAIADGSCVSRTNNAALFAVIGETYNACDSSTTFGLPDMRGRAAIGAGQGDGLTSRNLGDKIGEEAHTLTADENGPHNHSNLRNAASDGGSAWTLANYGSGSGSGNTTISGSGSPHNTMQPSIVINYIIKL